MAFKPCIAVDFDGTIVDWNYPDVGPIKEGCREALQSFRDMGYHVIIWSCRTCKWCPEVFEYSVEHRTRIIEEMRSALDSNSIQYDEIDDGSRGKPMADFYIDDKAITFQDNWSQIAAVIGASRGRIG